MEYEVVLKLKVDEEANFLEVGETYNLDVLESQIYSALHDLDDVTILEIDIIRRED